MLHYNIIIIIAHSDPRNDEMRVFVRCCKIQLINEEVQMHCVETPTCLALVNKLSTRNERFSGPGVSYLYVSQSLLFHLKSSTKVGLATTSPTSHISLYTYVSEQFHWHGMVPDRRARSAPNGHFPQSTYHPLHELVSSDHYLYGSSHGVLYTTFLSS